MQPSRDLEGTISLHPRGFGFLNYLGPSGPESAFITPPDLNGFLLDDVVRARVTTGSDGRHSAHELTLLRRKRSQLFGPVLERKGQLFLQTDREVSNTDWPLVEGTAQVGEFWLCSVRDQKAVARRRVQPEEQPLARLIARFDLRDEFTLEALAQAEEIASTRQALEHRRDLRHLQTVTIDAPSTRDIDDAISVIPAGVDGVLHLLISIADPAEAIAEGSPLDIEARTRATSTYLTGYGLPMLPEQLSSDALSLHPDQDRHALTAEIRIDAEGQVVAVDLYESLIRSTARLSYDDVADWMEHGVMTPDLDRVVEILPWLRTASARLAVYRQRRGGLRLESEVAEVSLDEQGVVDGTSPSRTTTAHQMIERFMVCANEAVARWLMERGLPGAFRIHPLPSPEQVATLSECAYNFGYEAGFARQLSPGSLAAFDAQISGAVAEPAIRSVLRGILGRARYTVEPGLHLGLAAPLYLHFTSPLRRYADLFVHRLIKGYLKGDRHFEVGDPQSETLCQHLNERAALSAKAESLRRRMLLAAYMERFLDQPFHAHITRVFPFGLVCQLDSSLVEGLLPLETLPGGPWESDSVSARSQSRRLTLGMPVQVAVASTDPDLGRIEFRLLES